ncbi:lyase family protein [Microbacterium sp.]|uniref:lyase family protein n=1 Tax=Microbacterium sp. TaxID=51671 RepID=UPI0037CC8C2C
MRDIFAWIGELDAASLIAVAEAGLAEPTSVRRAAEAIVAVRALADAPGSDRPTDYLDIQRLLRAQAGDDADVIHLGRSRQDILATVHRLLLRDRIIVLARAVLGLRRALAEQAAADPHAVVPAYTNGVQAQPTALGQQLLGYESALARSSERLLQCYRRVDRCPLGAAALATSSLPLDRRRLAELLGFAAPEDNAFDAAQLAPVDVGFEAAAAAAAAALTASTFIQDLAAQYHHSRPWLLLAAPALVAPSTLMPQKRNPVALGWARLLASEVIGDSMRAAMVGHNVPSGMTDYKRYDAADALDRATTMARDLTEVVRDLRLDADAAIAELGAEFATASHAAAALAAQPDISQREAHQIVSALVDDARAAGLGSAGVDAARVDRAVRAVLGPDATVDAGAIVAAFDPASMVAAARGLGGPQPAEVDRMLTTAQERIAADEDALTQLAAALQRADEERAARLARLMRP